ncbi:hypothetical protein [Andreprevotia lacus]|nr:hypothetical protein [Andreprevotia lacus]
MKPGRKMSALLLGLLVLQLGACASSPGANHNQSRVMDQADQHIVVGVTRREQVRSLMGPPSETSLDDAGHEVWIYQDVVKVPLLVSLIPIVGDVADVVEMTHDNRELIVQFDAADVVQKVKVRKVN